MQTIKIKLDWSESKNAYDKMFCSSKATLELTLVTGSS